MFRHSDSVISVRVRISPTGDIITYKVILRKTRDRQTDDREIANRKTGDKTGDKKILNETDNIKTQKCSVIVIPSYLSESSFHLQENIIMFKVILRKTCDRKTGDMTTAT
jgi:hypothetical protein